MSRRKLIGFGVLLSLAVLSACLLSKPSRPQLIGTLAPADLKEILRLVRQDLRSQLLPAVEWDSFRHPGYAITRIKEYYSQHILWAEVHDDGSVDVYAGASKDVIRDEGYVWTFRKVRIGVAPAMLTGRLQTLRPPAYMCHNPVNRTDMTIIFADYDPGSLTMLGILGLFGLASALCLACAAIAYLTKERTFCRRFLIAAGILFASGTVLGIVGKLLGEKFGFL